MKFFLILAGGFLIVWAVLGLRQASRSLTRECERCTGDLQEIAGELQALAAAIIAEMETEAAKLRELMAQASRMGIEALPRTDLTPAAEKETVNALYPEPIPLAEHVEKRKQRRTGRRSNNIAADGLKYQRVLDLAAAGWPEGEIAKETGIGKGEVQLILQLRK